MAGRPPKENIDFSGWEVDIFDNDPKIDKLIDGQGAAAFTIYFYLCQRAYGSKGYYYEWSYDDAATTARKIGGGIGSETVKQTVSLCLRIGLFDKRLFEGHGILTSSGIQKRFWTVAKDRNCNTVNHDFWLIDGGAESNKGTAKINYDGSKLNNDAPKMNNAAQQYSKVHDSKEKDTSSAGADPIPFSEIIGHLNRKAGRQFRVTDTYRTHIRARWNEGFRLDDFKRVVETKCIEWNQPPQPGKEDMRPFLRPETLFGTKFQGYLNQAPQKSGIDPLAMGDYTTKDYTPIEWEDNR